MPQKLVSEKNETILMTSQIRAIRYKQLDYDAVALCNYARSGSGVGVQQSTPEGVWQFHQ